MIKDLPCCDTIGALRTGAVVPQARVTARNVLSSFSRSAQTDETGNYLITLVVNQNARVVVTLTVGAVSESITVTAQPPDVDTRSSTIGDLVDRTLWEFLRNKALNGQKFLQSNFRTGQRATGADETDCRCETRGMILVSFDERRQEAPRARSDILVVEAKSGKAAYAARYGDLRMDNAVVRTRYRAWEYLSNIHSGTAASSRRS